MRCRVDPLTWLRFMVDIDTFIRCSPNPTWLATRESRCVYANPALQRLTGLNLDQISQADWSDFLLEDDRTAATASWQRSLAFGTSYRMHVRMRGFDGVPKTVELIAFGHKVSDGTQLWLFTGLHVNGAPQQVPLLEAQLRATLNVIPAYTWYALPSGALTFVNELNANYLGLPKDHPLRFGINTGAGWDSHIQLLHPDDHEETRRVWSTCLRTGCAGEVTVRVRNAEGGYGWFLSRVEPLRANDGTLVYWIGVNLDIDDGKRAEDALRKSEKELRDTIDTIPAIVWSALPDGSNTYANKRFVEYSGLSAEQTAGSGWQAAIHPDDLERHAGKWMEAIATGKPHDNEARFRRSDGQYRWHLDRGVPLRDEDGNIVKWYGVVTDIEDRKRAEQAQQRSEAYLAEAQRLSQTGSWAWSPDQDIRYWSEECYRVLSFDPQDGLPRFEDFFQRLHPDDQPGFRELIQTAIREKAEWEADYRIVHPDGPVRDIHVLGHPVLSTSGHLVEFVGTVIDVTERKCAEQEREKLRHLEADLAHINRVSTLGEMAASLSHELKQPITATISNANASMRWLKRDKPDLEEACEASERIVEDGKRAADIIDRLRSLYKKAPPKRELAEINEIIGEMVVLLRGEANRYGASIRTNLAADLPNISADRVQLQQVLMNLMLNGIEAMKEMGGVLTVKSELDQDGRMLISVSDTGVGLPAGVTDQIFSAFFTTKPQGSGMGLAISRSIIDSHGGHLWATANDGRGATFHFTLPTAA
jgi:PAS domain S-box-containing protein